MRAAWLALLLTWLCAAAAASRADEPKNVHVLVRAKFNRSSLLAEAAEFFDEPAAFWAFVDAVAAAPPGAAASHQKEFELALKIAREQRGEATARALEVALGAHLAAARVAMHRQMLEQHLSEAFPQGDAARRLASCAAVVFRAGSATCGVDGAPELSETAAAAVEALELDHVWPLARAQAAMRAAPGQAAEAVVLYGDPTQPAFAEAHRRLRERADAGGPAYVLRLVGPRDAHTPLHLQGFGVELAIKNMEYKVIDDRKVDLEEDLKGLGALGAQLESDIGGFFFARLLQRKPHLESELRRLRGELLNDTETAEKMNVWDIKDIGVQATQRIARSAEPLQLLSAMSQNFPMYGTALSRIRVNATVRKEVALNYKVVPMGTNLLEMNGFPLDAEKATLFELLPILRGEAAAVDALRRAGFDSTAARELLAVPLSKFVPDAHSLRLAMDAARSAADGGVIAWVNDLSDPSDPRYRQWSPTVQQLLSAGWPNQLRYVAKNLYQGVVVIDPTREEDLRVFATAVYFVRANAPIRIGVAFRTAARATDAASTDGASSTWRLDALPVAPFEDLLSEGVRVEGGGEAGGAADGEEGLAAKVEKTSLSRLVSRCVLYVERKFPRRWVELLEEVATLVDKGKLSHKTLRKAFVKRLEALRDPNADTAWTRVAVGAEAEATTRRVEEYVATRGLWQSAQPLLVVDGVVRDVSAESFREVMMHGVINDQRALQVEVYNGRVRDDTDMMRYWDTRGALPRLSASFTAEESTWQWATPAAVRGLESARLRFFRNARLRAEASPLAAVTHVVVLDLTSSLGHALLDSAVAYLQDAGAGAGDEHRVPTRVAFAWNHVSGSATPVASFARFVIDVVADEEQALAALGKLAMVARCVPRAKLAMAVDRLATQLGLAAGWAETKSAGGVAEELATFEAHRRLAAEAFHVGPSRDVLVSNERVVALSSNYRGDELRFDMALSDAIFFSLRRGKELRETLARHASGDANALLLDVHRVLTTRLAYRKVSEYAIDEAALQGGACSFNVSGAANAFVRVVAVIDPLSEVAQRASALLSFLHEAFGAHVRVFLHPRNDLSDLPLKRFYRMALNTQLAFDQATGALQPSPGALFAGIRSRNVLTAGIDTPEPWVVMLTRAAPDLDNLRLEELGAVSTLQVEYTLEHLLLAGQCIDTSTGEPPAGLQLLLGTRTQPHQQDTVVMQNLGYFQLKAAPGLWRVQIPPGRQRDIVYIVGADGVSVGYERSFAVSGFDDPLVNLRARRHHGKLREDLLEQPADAGLWGRVSGFFAGSNGGGADGEGGEGAADKTVHVFSLASGHLYERFLRIMMLSVVRSTKAPVKFWFIRNFLSPQFVEFVPKMAAHYGYQVELVTYKWPAWLRRQTQKQRIIWGYKILFLDVLFPLKLHRVIYIDADQVVRGDLTELWTMDLKGAPYGYTPFCDSNPLTEGFRFWKQGYWRSHLKDKAYHISALYVVDLDRFRRMRAGDSLRIMYDQLTMDPNSLANLDQDLPNYAQHMVPIFSLPQEWLWCETWCSLESLPSAKTIDLCNNPLTKAPKLDVARRLLPEWTQYDQEATRLAEELQEGHKREERLRQDAETIALAHASKLVI